MKNGGPFSSWNCSTSGLALFDTGTTVQHQTTAAEHRTQMRSQRLDDLAELGENQYPLLALGKLLANFGQTQKFAAVAGR